MTSNPANTNAFDRLVAMASKEFYFDTGIGSLRASEYIVPNKNLLCYLIFT